jgi:cellulose synthase/poly-beta-1,6-N-acetylglucosamine synthase-like glycosyltransferase
MKWCSGLRLRRSFAQPGYAVWLWLRSRWAPRPVRRGPLQPAVSAILVVRHEEAVIARKIENLLTLDYPPKKMQVVVVSDGSSDGTPAVLNEFASTSRVKILLKSESQGKALGLNDAIKLARGEILLFTDARQAIEPAALRLLIENFADPAVGCVSGELMLGDPASGETERGMGLYWRTKRGIRELESTSGRCPATVRSTAYVARC